MIKALLLMFSPAETWDRIVAAQKRIAFVLAVYLFPLVLVTSIIEGWGLVHWGKPRLTNEPLRFPMREAVSFEIAQGILSFVVVLVGASLVKMVGETFHGRHTYRQALTTVAYALSPVFLLRALNAFQGVSPWITWGIGVAFSVAVLYHGIPRVMQPDPPQAFGLYVMSAFLLILVTGLACFLSAAYLQGRLTKLNALFSLLDVQS